jgi:hypothetical protein
MKEENFSIEDYRLTEDASEAISIAKAKAKVATVVKRKPFKARFVQRPMHWVEALRRSKSSARAHVLADIILAEDLKREYVGGEVVLSSTVTGMSRSSRRRAARELEALGLIKVTRDGNQALRATPNL